MPTIGKRGELLTLVVIGGMFLSGALIMIGQNILNENSQVNAKFVGDSQSKIFYDVSCKDKIETKNTVYFVEEQSAIESNYTKLTC